MEETLKKITEENLNKIDESEWDYKIFDYILEEKIGDNYQEKAGIIEKLPIGLKFWYATWELFFANVFVNIMRSKMTALTTLFLIMNYSIYSYFL